MSTLSHIRVGPRCSMLRIPPSAAGDDDRSRLGLNPIVRVVSPDTYQKPAPPAHPPAAGLPDGRAVVAVRPRLADQPPKPRRPPRHVALGDLEHPAVGLRAPSCPCA